ncbi:MAG: N-acetyl-gamma-glutamyl-phosphate reductase [bacterium]|nr:N-acetyl-gamma-glutamyl-phosphate reductase [bacterium]
MDKVKVSIVGCSGYAGGELLRLLLFHPNVEVQQITSERYAGKPVGRVHPNLRKLPQTKTLKFEKSADIKECDLLFLALPHGDTMEKMSHFQTMAPKLIDLSGDFRLNCPDAYKKWYGHTHVLPEMLTEFVYGIPELHREEMKTAKYVSSAGCNATVTILALYPLFKNKLIHLDRTIVEVKAGTSEGGASHSAASHHPIRSGCIRAYKPFGHRHVSEMKQELSFGDDITIHFTATSTDMIRGIHCVSHAFLKDDMDEKAIWKTYRNEYGKEPFVRIIKEKDGLYRFPEPKLLAGTNYCDVGFVKDPESNRVIIYSALDNLMKGAGGQALQAFNLMHGFEETLGLEFPGLHPVAG